jgi:hypothetical protein
MDPHSTPSGESASDTASNATPASREEFYVVNFPLTPSEIEWLKQQSKLVEEASIRFFERKRWTDCLARERAAVPNPRPSSAPR